MDNRVQLYMRPNTPHWQCSCSVAGKQRRTTTKEESLARAKDVARDWYLGLLGKYRAGELKEGKTFAEAAERFMDEYETITAGERSPIYVDGHKFRIRLHLNPFFGKMVLSEITAGTIQDYRIHRMKTGMSRADQLRKDNTGRKIKPPSRSALHQEIVCLRQILKTANRQGWLAHLPNMTAPFRQSGKVSHRAWFSPEEYKALYTATRDRANNPLNERWRWASEQLHDFVLVMGNTGLRPDEIFRLEFRDVKVEEDDGTGKTILVIKVRGKRGTGYCKSTAGAVKPFLRLQRRKRPVQFVQGARATERENDQPRAKAALVLPEPTDLIFPKTHRDFFKNILNELDLKTDREGNERTIYSIRHTYICTRLSEGANIYELAKNCRTSVEMIQKFYAPHIQNVLDASAINVVRVKRRAKSPKTKSARS